MSVVTITRLCRDHNDAALALADTRTTGGSYKVDRTPDYFALGERLGRTTTYGAFAGRRLVGSLAVSIQTRFVGGRPAEVPYVHDARVHPEWAGRGVFARLRAAAIEDHLPVCGWGIATMLETNDHDHIVRGTSPRRPGLRVLGHTAHVGFRVRPRPAPPAMPGPAAPARVSSAAAAAPAVVRLDPVAAWDRYAALAVQCDFAPADGERFLALDGPCLGVRVAGRLVAVCRIEDQSACRRIRFAGEPVDVGYLSYYASVDGIRYDRVLVDWVARHRAGRFAYLFAGMSRADADAPGGDLSFGSTTWIFGPDAPDRRLEHHELSLI